jgi:hypothetical protein
MPPLVETNRPTISFAPAAEHTQLVRDRKGRIPVEI